MVVGQIGLSGQHVAFRVVVVRRLGQGHVQTLRHSLVEQIVVGMTQRNRTVTLNNVQVC